jgi:hypothetical protein
MGNPSLVFMLSEAQHLGVGHARIACNPLIFFVATPYMLQNPKARLFSLM